MNSKEYMYNVRRSESPSFEVLNERLLHGAIGCCTESGELLDVIKKSLFYKRGLNTSHLMEEMGDIFWYLGLMCDELGIAFERIMDMNIKKLKEQYPEQFTEQDEQNRDYKAEDEAANR